MAKILVIPDLHLKTVPLVRAEKILSSGKADKAIILGDLLDDFYATPETYKSFWEMFMEFYETHRDRLILLYGNHEISYLINRPVTGNTKAGERYAELYRNLSPKIIHLEDKAIFSHAGIFNEFLVSSDLSGLPVDKAVSAINTMPLEKLWNNDSPIWARPQFESLRISGDWLDYIQVAGHTPMQAIELSCSIISVDVFSTNWGKRYGEERLIVIDSKTGEYYKLKTRA